MRPRTSKGESHGDIDAMLTEFFRADMPNPWPPPPGMPACETKPSETLAKATPRRREGMPGKWALAVSIAALALIGAWLFQMSPTPPDPTTLDKGTATVPAHLQPQK